MRPVRNPQNQIRCPKCSSRYTIKKGVRRNKFQGVQVYRCRQCGAVFSSSPAKSMTYPIKIILNAVSLYNLGYSQKEVSGIIARRFRVRVPERTISSWVKKFKGICRFSRMRKEATGLYSPGDMIFSRKLFHTQIYNFQLHRAKLELLEKSNELPEQKFRLLKAYLERVSGPGNGYSNQFPHHIFSIPPESRREEKRASQLDMNLLKIAKLQKRNYANMLAEIALKISPDNRARHETIQSFMVANDSVTIAAEVPVYLTAHDINYFQSRGFTLNFQSYRTPITGHIDILQVRNGLIHILDYKPEAGKIDAANQLTIYALALASRTKLAVRDFKCAWFDHQNYCEFFPLHAVYRKRVDMAAEKSR